MQKNKSKTKNEILTKLNELEALLKKKNDHAYRQASKPLNFNQAADYLGFSHSYLYKLTSRKIIPCHRPTGKMLFFSKAELDEWIFENRNQELGDSSQNEKELQDDDEPP
ncbi:MAG: helix-turn-helix domain-containing protein [Bacteroidetes bacterium]|nr:helix-turn-helix domain-containing protein [Bacteroidota bacterium]